MGVLEEMKQFTISPYNTNHMLSTPYHILNVKDTNKHNNGCEKMSKENEIEELKLNILRLMYEAEHKISIKKYEERCNVNYAEFKERLLNGEEHL